MYQPNTTLMFQQSAQQIIPEVAYSEGDFHQSGNEHSIFLQLFPKPKSEHCLDTLYTGIISISWLKNKLLRSIHSA